MQYYGSPRSPSSGRIAGRDSALTYFGDGRKHPLNTIYAQMQQQARPQGGQFQQYRGARGPSGALAGPDSLITYRGQVAPASSLAPNAGSPNRGDSVVAYWKGSPREAALNLANLAKTAYQRTKFKEGYLSGEDDEKALITKQSHAGFTTMSSPDGGTTRVVADADRRPSVVQDASTRIAPKGSFEAQANGGLQQLLVASVAAAEAAKQATQERCNRTLGLVVLGAALLYAMK